MFSTFKIVVLYFIISPICANTLPPNGGSTTLSSQEQLNKEWYPLQDRLQKIMDSLTSIDLKVELGRILGIMEAKIEQKIKAEREVKQLHEEKGGIKGVFKNEKERIIKNALRTFVVPYVCRNFELYEKVWYNGGNNSENFNPNDIENTDVKRHDLDTQTMGNYKQHAVIWDRILTSSPHPLVTNFKVKIQSLYTELSLQVIAKNLGLVHALLQNNAKHGAINDAPEMVKLINPDNVIVALKGWSAFKDPVILGIIKTFEQVISGL